MTFLWVEHLEERGQKGERWVLKEPEAKFLNQHAHANVINSLCTLEIIYISVFFLSSLHNLIAERLKILSEDFITEARSGQWLLRHDISLWGQQQRHCTDSPSCVLVGRFLSIPERAVAVTESSVSTPLALQKAPWELQRHSFSNSTCCHLMEVRVKFTCWDHTRFSSYISSLTDWKVTGFWIIVSYLNALMIILHNTKPTT